MAAARTLVRRRMGACETTPPATPGDTYANLQDQHEDDLPRFP
jgi:hypothetical protein